MVKSRKVLMLLVLAIRIASISAFAQENAGPVLQNRNPRYELRKSDTLELNFPFVPAFNQTAMINPDGYVTLRPLGDIQVEGKTLPELTEILRSKYGEFLRDPVLLVELRDFEKPYFIVGGYVEHPAKYDLRGATTVVQAVAIAGGFKQGAKHSQVLVFRQSTNNWVEVRELNMKDMLNRSRLQEDLYLRTGDMVWVPQNLMSKVKPFLPTFSFSPYFNPFQR